MDKRCYTTSQAQVYLGIKRSFFDTHIAPLLKGKGIPAGTAIVYEKADLDAAWDRYKLVAGNGRPAQTEGNAKWDVQRHPASSARMPEHMKLTLGTENSAFAAAASRGMKMRKHS